MSFICKTISASLGALIFVSCHSTPNSPNSPITADVKGRVMLVNYWGNSMPSFNGIAVTIDSTSQTAVTDDSGYFEFPSAPEGTYNVRFSKPGFGDVRWMSQQIVGGGGAPTYWGFPITPYFSGSGIHLIRIPDMSATLQTGQFVDTTITPGFNGPYLIAEGETHPGPSFQKDNEAITIFVSHTSDVSFEPGHYVVFFNFNAYTFYNSWVADYAIDKIASRFRIPIQLTSLDNEGFRSGDSIYIAAYASAVCSGWSSDYYDPNYHQYVLTSIDKTPSLVIGLKIP